MATSKIKRQAWNYFETSYVDNYIIGLESVWGNTDNYKKFEFVSATGSEGATIGYKRPSGYSYAIRINGVGVQILRRTSDGVWQETEYINKWGGGT